MKNNLLGSIRGEKICSRLKTPQENSFKGPLTEPAQVYKYFLNTFEIQWEQAVSMEKTACFWLRSRVFFKKWYSYKTKPKQSFIVVQPLSESLESQHRRGSKD